MTGTTRIVGRYELYERIGRGGMAVVYRARQTHPRRSVALKELRALHDDDPAYAQRFLREADLAGALSHPNIVTVYDYFEHDGTPYIAMEYVEGGSLRPYLADVSVGQIIGVLEGLLAGLMHAERVGIVHRDLKPENVMVTADGHVKITDFGIAKATTQLQTAAFLTATGITVGTPRYMAPEQAMAQAVGPWSDLYSVGCMTFEMLTGRGPFRRFGRPRWRFSCATSIEPIPSVRSGAALRGRGPLGLGRATSHQEPGRSRRRPAHVALGGARGDRESGFLAPVGGGTCGSRQDWVAAPTRQPLLAAPLDGTSVPGPSPPPPTDLPPGPMLPTAATADYETFQGTRTRRPFRARAGHERPRRTTPRPPAPRSHPRWLPEAGHQRIARRQANRT